MMMKAVLKMVMLSVMMFGINISIASAALINGSMGLTGSYSTAGGSDQSDATTLDLNSVVGTNGTGDITTVTFGTIGIINNGSFSLAAFAPVNNVLDIGGYQLDLTSMSITDQTASLLTLSGTGFLSNGANSANTIWTFSGGTSDYSMTITAVPVPAAVWLFGSGLIGLVAVARRKTV